MFFAGSDTELLDIALSPPLATWHYFFVVVMTPLIMLNLLIALMGGSYERIEQNTKNAMRRQKAELLVSLEVLMSNEDKRNVKYFPRWLFWYRPAERQAEDTTDENGVINGVDGSQDCTSVPPTPDDPNGRRLALDVDLSKDLRYRYVLSDR